MTRPQDLYADEVNRLMRIAWANPERYNAAFPKEHIDATTPMPVFVADHGWYVNGVKTRDPYPEISEDYNVPEYPPEWSLPPVDHSVPLELDGTPVKIHHTSWPVGYHRQKDVWTVVQARRTGGGGRARGRGRWRRHRGGCRGEGHGSPGCGGRVRRGWGRKRRSRGG